MGMPVKRTMKGSKVPKAVPPSQLSAGDYFEEAEMAYFTDDIEGARAAFKQAIELEPDNVEFLDGYGAFLAENGPREESIAVLQRACELAPNHGFEKFMYLGQVLDSEDRTAEAEKSMRRGVEILRAEIGEFQDHPELAGSGGDEAAEELAESRENLREALSSALCSLAELLMGAAADAADEAEDDMDAAAALAASPALAECEQLLGEAQSLWPHSPEPLQALCSLRRLQSREEEALALLQQSLALWYRPEASEDKERNEVDNKGDPKEVGGDADVSGMDADIANCQQPLVDLPSYEFRFETAKLLLELDENTETAAAVLEGLLEENDTVPDVWLLLAVAYRSGGELEAAAEAAALGAAMARKLGFSCDHEVVAALSELESELGTLVVDREGTCAGRQGEP